ncbi:MerR family transcriptional regulator [Mycolicibacterium flavescens]|uniref:Transcriptional regulator n=1 Tax=Mycolicibacterium flavescens TaxID=1776 RepID=A0A1E3RSH9_MYCFV|nr:MerR family transcriptional regulator [Mycolicibacterium flavescens]MCV7279743.1 MerR family transcriptional regulator [Mycolicibacterium flavescens]ODQ92382.1 transcriptional regulator [Mycolicibacterium flavescens]
MSDADQPMYTVRVVAERVGVPTATLRSWSQRYGVGPSHHVPGRHRLYSENDVTVVQRMHALIRDGASPRSAAQMAAESIAPPRGDVEALLSAAFELDLPTLGRLLESHLRHFGVLDTWELVVRPAFAAIVSRQQDEGGCIDVEHALSWAVSRALQRVPLAPSGTTTSIVLACAAGETHVLALEALRAALGERGHGALMLGADVPAWALIDAIGRITVPVTAMLWSHSADTADMDTVRAVSAQAEVVLAGPGWVHVPDVAPGVHVGSLAEALRRWEVSE